MIHIEQVEAAQMPHPLLDAYAVHWPGDVVFVVRDDLGPEQLAAAVNRIGARMTREAVDAPQRGITSTTE